MALTQIKSSNIEDGTVAAADIADDAIDGTKIADNAIDSEHYLDGSIDASKLAGLIPASKLASTLDLSSKTVQLPAASVTAHAVPAEIGFSNVSGWADSAVKTVTLSIAAAGIGKAQVKIYEEIPDVNKTNGNWDISTNDTGFNLINSAYAQTLTPAATTGSSIAFTLGGGSWVTADIGKRIVNVSTSEAGEARIISIAGTVATCTITTTFTDTNAIASGDWELLSAEFVSGNFVLSNATVIGGAGVSKGADLTPFNTSGQHLKYNSVTALSATKAICAFNDDNNGTMIGKACVLNISGTTVTAGALFTFNNAKSNQVVVEAVSSTQAILVWADSANTYDLTACVLTENGSSVLSKGSNLTINSGGYGSSPTPLSRMPGTTKCVITYQQFGGILQATILTQSGTSVTKQSVPTISSQACYFTDVVCLTDEKAIVAWRDNDSTKGHCKTLTMWSDGSITQGAQFNFTTAFAYNSSVFVERLTDTTALLGWAETNSYIQVLSSASTTITTPTAKTTVETGMWETADSHEGTTANLADNRVVFIYVDGSPTTRYMRIVETSGTTITLGAAQDLGTTPDNQFKMTKLSATKFLITSRYETGYGQPGYREGVANVVTNESSLYILNQYVTTISGTDSVDTTYYSDWNSNTITETLGGQSAYYAFSVNSTPSATTITGGTFMVIGTSQTATRNIVSSLSSVHGGTAGVWYKNTNATYGSATWAAATTNEAKAAIQEATATAANQMNGTAFAAISDTNLPAFGTQLSVAMTLYSTSSAATPSIDGVSFNYDGNVINRLETDVYTVEMPSTAAIRVTAPSSGGPRNARVYVSS